MGRNTHRAELAKEKKQEKQQEVSLLVVVLAESLQLREGRDFSLEERAEVGQIADLRGKNRKKN